MLAINKSRRQMISTVIFSGWGIGALVEPSRAQRQATATPDGRADLIEADAPSWKFGLRALDDPYVGKMVFPSMLDAGMRLVRAEVVITNNSEQALDFQVSNVRLLDSEGIEYGAGNAQGAEPRLVSQVLPSNERSRGSVWFIVPMAAELVEIKFYAPPPQLRLRLPPPA